jgi:hypothetical protein
VGLKREVGGRNIMNSLFGSYGKRERKREIIYSKRIIRLLNGLENKYVQTTCGDLTFSGKISIEFTFNIIMSADSIVIRSSSTCSRCISWHYLITGLTLVKGIIPFEISGDPAFKTLMLTSSIVLSISCSMRVV